MTLIKTARTSYGLKGLVFLVSAFLVLFSFCTPLLAATSSTTLGITPVSPVASGTVLTLTATVASGGIPVGAGLVTFCNTAAAHCEDGAVLGTAALTPSGTATTHLRLGPGTTGIAALFQGTKTYAASISAAQNVTVAPPTSISATGSAGNYTLTGTVTVPNSQALSGTVSFMDASDGNYLLGSATLASGAVPMSFSSAPTPTLSGVAGQSGVVGDFNNDGIPDMAVLQPNGVVILLGKGDGTFTTGATVAIPSNPWSTGEMAVGDFNGDGKLDIAVITYNNPGVDILLGNGDGTFSLAPASISSAYIATYNPLIAVGDFNGDGKLDIAIATGYNTISIFLGNGNGTFTVGPKVALPADGPQDYAVVIQVGDFNGDGKLDMAVSGIDSDYVYILLGNGDGTFTLKSKYSIPYQVCAIVVGDFNGDGKPDLAVQGGFGGSINILLGNGDGTFTLKSSLAVSSAQYILAAADFDGDGKLDLAVSDNANDSVDLYLGNGDGTFTAGPSLADETGSGYLLVGDFNGDGRPDIASSNYTDQNVNIFLNHGGQVGSGTVSGVTIYGGGVHNVFASYGGNTSYPSSQSEIAEISNSAVTTTTTLAVSPSTTVTYGTVMQLTGSVVPHSSGSNASSGTMSFYDGGVLLGGGAVGDGQDAITVNDLSVGAHLITAVYGGDTNFLSSMSSATAVTVSPPSYILAAPTTAVSDVVGSGASVTLNLTSKGYAGTVSFTTVITSPDGIASGCNRNRIASHADLRRLWKLYTDDCDSIGCGKARAEPALEGWWGVDAVLGAWSTVCGSPQADAGRAADRRSYRTGWFFDSLRRWISRAKARANLQGHRDSHGERSGDQPRASDHHRDCSVRLICLDRPCLAAWLF